jgi:hypothetical protein
MNNQYISQETFDDISRNQTELINVLNHRMTGLENSVSTLKNDVVWIKRIGLYLSGLLSALVVGILTKLIMGV